MLLGGRHAPAIEPADPDLIPEAREVLIYLESIYGKRTLIGQDKFWEAERFHDACGKYPAIVSSDLSGWSKTHWDDQYQRTLQRAGPLAPPARDRRRLVLVVGHEDA